MNSVFPLINDLYGIDANGDNFEDIALSGWEIIGNKHTRLYKYTADTNNGELVLPCNVDIIEAVYIPIIDAQVSNNRLDSYDGEAINIENYIEKSKQAVSPFYIKGKLIKYKEGNGVLYFDRDFKDVTVLYHGVLVEEETGLPLINNKEEKALAAYIAWRETYKDGLKKRDRNILQFAKDLEIEWLRKCNAARIPERLTQNDMNNILDVKACWDRKLFNKTYNPIK